MKKLIALVLATLMVCAAFTACSNSGSAANTKTTTTATPTKNQATEPTVEEIPEEETPDEEIWIPNEEEIPEGEVPEEDMVPAFDDEASDEYQAIFDNLGISDIPTFFESENYAAFAYDTTEEGMIVKYEFGYNDDTISDFALSFYFSISDLTNAEKDLLETTMNESLLEYEDIEFCNTTGSVVMDNYISFSVSFTDLDSAAAVAAMEEADLLPVADVLEGLLSMSTLEAALIDEGAVKR